MGIVDLVARDTGLGHLLIALIGVAAAARRLAVLALQGKIRLFVIELDPLPRPDGMALGTARPETAFMGVVLLVAVNTTRGRLSVLDRRLVTG